MRYALISDIHANLPALEAVLTDIDGRADVDAVFHLGDLVGYAPWPDETVAMRLDRGITGVEGITFLNTGSVGRPKDGDWRAGYTLFELSGAEPEVEHIRVEYDIDRAMAAISASELPDELAHYLRSGGATVDPV